MAVYLFAPALALCALPPNNVQAQGLPAPPKPDYSLLDEFNYRNTAAARALWQSKEGAGQVTVVHVAGRKILRMPCEFAGAANPAATWDGLIKLDLRACQGVQFKLFCANPKPITKFTFYFRSGKGWYGTNFYPAVRTAWSTVRIMKSQTWTEGKPTGWGKIDGIRIRAWRAENVNTVFHIAEPGLLGGEGEIVILRNDYGARNLPLEASGIQSYAMKTARYLADLGVPYVLLSDLDLSPELLRGKELVVLPYNPGMSTAATDMIGTFLESGGKLVCFYILPPQLESLVQIKRGKHLPEEYGGHFASIRPSGEGLAGLPPIVTQRSWNIYQAMPIEGRSRVAAYWYNDKDTNTNEPALVVSDNCMLMTHVLLSDDPNNQEIMLLAMLGYFLPELWRPSAKNGLEQAGRFGPYQTTEQAIESIRQLAQANREATALLEQAGELRGKAARQFLRGEFIEALAGAGRIRELLATAYCACQQPEKGEHRAFWCHWAFGVSGMDWDEAIRQLADNGFTAIIPNMLWGNIAYYDSDVLPVAPEVREKGDPLASCLAACKKYGIECHVWKVNWFMSKWASEEFGERMKQQGRTQVTHDGKPLDDWLCPSHPANRKLEIDSMLEVVRKYDVDGIHFDYIRYPGPQGCFCKVCRRRFEETIGAKVEHWPADVREDGALKQKWLDFRRNNITAVVAAVSEGARKIKPDIKISAAVFRNWPSDRDSVAQDWKLWCEKGYLDFVCPMDYTPSSRDLEQIVRQQLTWAGDVPVYPGIKLRSEWSPLDGACKLIEQVRVTRKLRTGGFTLFNYGPTEARQILPLCGMGLTRRDAEKDAAGR